MIELHCHTTCSDGTLTPAELVQAAYQAGVKVLAITDHDTLAGWDEAEAAAQGLNLEIVPGLELSTTENGKSIHILGFYPDSGQLAPFLEERLAGRRRRAIAMADKLAQLGYPIVLPELNGNSAPGRPHLATALVEAGHVSSRDEAFTRLLRDGGPAYVPYEKLNTCEGIQALRQAGAVPVWAHAYLWKGGSIEKTLPKFVEAGLMGLEVFHPHHMPHQREKLIGLCQHYDLLMTGGSDYHGPSPESAENRFKAKDSSENVSLRGLNRYQLGLELFPPLKAAAQQSRMALLSQ